VHWIWGGVIFFVYELHPLNVVKVPKLGEYKKQQVRKEVKIYQIFPQKRSCPSIVQCFFFSGNDIFSEYMRGKSL
jgi:hypothetical protein